MQQHPSSTQAATPASLGLRLRLWLRKKLVPCPGKESEYLGELPSSASDALAARGADVGLVGPREPVFFFSCTEGGERCETCPRFQSFWQGVAARQARIDQLKVAVGAAHGETYRSDRDGEATEVHYLDAKRGRACVRENSDGWLDPNPHPVIGEGAPGAHHAERCARDGDSQRNQLQPGRLHVTPLLHGSMPQQGGAQ